MLRFEVSVHRRDAESTEETQRKRKTSAQSLRLCGEQIRFERARPEDRSRLEVLLRENGMEVADPMEDFMLAWVGDEIAGCGRIEDYPDVAMVRPLVVAESFRRRGIGRLLLARILPVGKPAVIVARGESASFYTAFGFTLASWQTIPIHQAHECTSCPDRTECRPRPMICWR